MAPTIDIPRLEEESAPAYAARVDYITAGPQRSLDLLAKDPKWAKSRSRLGIWSVQHGWVDSARRYDSLVSSIAAQRAAEQYIAELEDHRKRYQKAGKDLFVLGQRLMAECGRAIRGEVIQGADGREYTIPAMELNINALNTAMRCIVTAGDLEAHALQVEGLKAQLTPDDSE